MIYKIMPVVMFFFMSFSSNVTKTNRESAKIVSTTKTNSFTLKVETIYNNLQANSFALPKLESFSKALQGFYILKDKGLIQKDILTLVDFSLSANKKRLWVIDLTTNTILYQSLVAHGKNTGDEFANAFSNSPNSFKSSLGFYSTGDTYLGKHGLSLQLDGLEKGINDKARERAIVMHGADYANENFIRHNGRLGRSLGCPAIPMELRDEIIEAIKGKSCLFIYHPSKSYESKTKLI